jgi:hypothetical protein
MPKRLESMQDLEKHKEVTTKLHIKGRKVIKPKLIPVFDLQ